MDANAQLDTILRLFEQLGIEVRLERLGGNGGGLCNIRRRRVVFVDVDADVASRLDRCVEGLAALPEAASLFISPEIRERIDRLRGSDADESQGEADHRP